MKKTIRALSLVLVCTMLMPLIVACQPANQHEHNYSEMVTTAEFLNEEGSCSKKSTYFYSCECGEKGTEIFEGDYAYAHNYDQKNTDAKYLKENVSCTQKAVYYYSCKCGEKGTETFEGESTSDHVFNQKNTDEKYIKEKGSCSSKALYYYSCKCGEKGEEVFEGDYIHNFGDKITTYEYFASDSTATTATQFYNYCKSCGESTTFEFGKTDSQRAPVGSKVKEKLDGKKILIVGCSYNYYGKIVNPVNVGVTTQTARDNNQGYFWELCRQNGADVELGNWCFGGHDLSDLLGTSCAADRGHDGFNHLAALKDRNFDYVSLMDIGRPSSMTLEKYIEELKGFMKIFTDVNPNCKFIYSIPCGAYWYQNADRPNFKELYVGTVYAKEIAKLPNMVVMDWGKMIHDLVKGNAKVPNSTFTYNANSFIVADGYHPNLLSGYINTLMTYCLITGETAVGQPINLENGSENSQAAPYKKSVYVANYYKGQKTNFIEIMDSASEMANIQKVVNRYIDMQTYLYY